ncbi:hypothetical protein K7G98_03660 [Saccharothrix sp. MB29]|nr:hypothetical protein [Saccharothrix sp. MB29]
MRDDVAGFDAGEAAAFDPQPVRDAGGSGERITSLTSWWHTRWCQVCGHTFRRGDRVLVADSRVRHLDPTLDCAESGGGRADEAEVVRFTEGLLATWPVVGDVPLTRTDDVPGLLAPPLGGLRRAACLFCAHTFRPGEFVVMCPCTPAARVCARAVHRDPARGLPCWESWRPGSTLKVCPVTLTRLAT